MPEPILQQARDSDYGEMLGRTSVWLAWIVFFPDPPKNLCQNLPLVMTIHGHGFILRILRVEHLGVVVASETGNRQSHIFVPGHYNLPVQFGWIILRGVYHEN